MLEKLPSVHGLLSALQKDFPEVKPRVLTAFIQRRVEEVRRNPHKFALDKTDKDAFHELFYQQIRQALARLLAGSLKQVINATGVVLHTNLGRAPLYGGIARKWNETLRYTNLEINLESGKRGQRNDHLNPLLQLLTGAERGLAVNNNAAAVMLMLNTTGNRKEVILSRGEMVEIGGSFRLPEVMKISGCKLKEVGTTNKTHFTDYQQALSAKTGAILICHSSNYEIRGFTSKPPLEKLVTLARQNGVPLIYDLGSGLADALPFDTTYPEPLIREVVAAGVDLVSFSGDKLLGGPQAGLIVGREDWVKKCEKNHLLRALRLDKMMITALQETLIRHCYQAPELPGPDALSQSAEALRSRSEAFVARLADSVRNDCKVVDSKGKVGSGSYPTYELPSAAIKVQRKKSSASALAKAFRLATPAVIGYIENDAFYLDLRAVSTAEEETLRNVVEQVLTR